VGGKAPFLLWSDSTTAGTERNNLGQELIKVTITDGKSCQIAETFIITEPLPLELKATVSNIYCDNAKHWSNHKLSGNRRCLPHLHLVNGAKQRI
jgi:hypothetical protein